MTRVLKTIVPVTAIAVGLMLASAQAVVPPRDCGRMTVSHKRWRIKSDQLSCKTARRYAKAYIAHRTRPRGYSCHRYKNSGLYAKCVNTRANPDRTIFILKQ